MIGGMGLERRPDAWSPASGVLHQGATQRLFSPAAPETNPPAAFAQEPSRALEKAVM